MLLHSVHLWFLTSAVLAVGACVLAVGRRRQQRAVGEFSELLQRLTLEPGSAARIGLGGRPEPLQSLALAVNRLLEILEQRDAVLQSREHLFQRLVENVNHAVMVHRRQILSANARCLSLLGTSAAEVIGRPLSAFAAPDYVELVDDNLRRRLAGEPAAERYEVELIGADGELTRLELSSALIDIDGEPALLLTALEMLPQPSTPGSPSSHLRALATLDAMGESVITVEPNGRIDYLNDSAAALLGQRLDQVIGKSFPEVASLVDEMDHRPLGDPVRMASTAGKRVTMDRRAVLVPANGAAERSVELGVTPLGLEDGAAEGWVLVLHDSNEWRRHEEAGVRHYDESHWLQRLQGALRDHSFELYRQAIVHAQADGVRGPAIEVFLRLSGEHGQPVAPSGEFIRVAERHRLMPAVDRWVVQAVLSAVGCGSLQLPAGRSVAINIAGQTLCDPEFLDFLVECFDSTGANPNEICFEVSEPSAIANLDSTRRFIAVLHGIGCEFTLDDFGSGLCTFATLQTLPMDYLKISGSFVGNLTENTVNQDLVAAIIDLSRSREFRVIAEQIEDPSALESVKRMGIDFVQGYAIARPELLSAPARLPGRAGGLPGGPGLGTDPGRTGSSTP